jgi:hypothetical protein
MLKQGILNPGVKYPFVYFASVCTEKTRKSYVIWSYFIVLMRIERMCN